MKKTKVPNLDVIIYDLTDYKDMIETFCNSLIENKQLYFLGPDDETNKLNIWDEHDGEIKIFESIMDGIIFDFLQNEHPRFKNIREDYTLDKDSWLNTPTTWQGQRIHRHWEPFLRPDEIGDVTTVLYIKQDETINLDNGCLEFYESSKENPLDHVWLPENMVPVFKYIPKPYTMVVMTSETWHGVRPFTGERYSLATDAKAIMEN